MIKKIISGGQTGADRAALDLAITLNLPYGGWIPKGRKSENGILPDKYKLKEMPTTSYSKRTEQNVLDSDGTLIVSRGKLIGGSALTKELAEKHGRPCLHVDLSASGFPEPAKIIHSWIIQNGIETLNVAGPRAGEDPEIHKITMHLLGTVFSLDRPLRHTLPPSGHPIKRELKGPYQP
jgi:hypothetical protein